MTAQRTAWVTGAAGGIGSAVCRRLRADGFHVVGLDRSASADADTSVECDLSDAESIAHAAELATAAGTVGAIVHVAAEQVLGAAGEPELDDWQRAFLVNVVSLDLLVGAAGAALRDGGSVVAVSSVHASATTGGIVAYATTKAALHGWVRAAALDLGPGVRVNAVAPGAVDTAMLAEGFARWGSDAPARRGVLESRTALGRISDPSEIAAAVAFLVGPDSSFVTGTVLGVDGGALARLGTE